MKILVINWQDIRNPFGGGAEVYLHEVFGRIARMGHEVHILVCGVPGLPSDENMDGFLVHRRGFRNIFNYQLPGIYKKEFSGLGFDIVIEDLNKLPFYTRRFVKGPKIACLAMHFFGKAIFQELPPPMALYVYLYELSMRRSYKGLPFAVISESTKNDLIGWGFGSDIRVIYSGVDTETYRPGEKFPEPTVVYVGRLKRYKRIELAMETVAKVAAEIPLRFHIVGEGEYRPALERFASARKMTGYTTFHGFISQAEKSKLLAGAWVMINTSVKEGWGLVNTEAQASGTPVVAFDVPGIRESLVSGRTGFLVPFGDTDALADSLRELLLNHDLRERMSREARKWVGQFSWDRSAREMIEWIESIMKAG
ncbi:MAG: glycosyltransferase family 4 protein [candidate division WOR-3 bacterium]